MYLAFKLPQFLLFHIFYLATIRTNSDELIIGETHEFRDLSVTYVKPDWSLSETG